MPCPDNQPAAACRHAMVSTQFSTGDLGTTIVYSSADNERDSEINFLCRQNLKKSERNEAIPDTQPQKSRQSIDRCSQ